MTGLVVVSHSRALADAAVALASEMLHGSQVRIAVAAGLDATTFGTDATAIVDAVTAADDGEGVVVLMDLGSAVLSAEMALDLIEPTVRDRAVLCPAPLVEGLVVAAVAAAGGAPPAQVAAEAIGSLAAKQAHANPTVDALDPHQPHIDATDAAALLSAVVKILNPHGLHARPAARLVQVAQRYAARVQLRNLDTGAGPVPATSLSRVAALGALHGHRVEVSATGAQAREALEHVVALAERRFDEPVPAVTEQAAPTRYDGGPLAASPGIAIGPALSVRSIDVEVPDEDAEDEVVEWRRMRAAVAEVRRHIQRLRVTAAREVGEAEAAIFDAHLLLVDDAELLDDVHARIRTGLPAARAWLDAIGAVEAGLATVPDPYLRARAADVHGVGQQVARVLVEAPEILIDGEGVVIADDLTPAQVADLDPTRVKGLVLASGSPTGHSAILARSRAIPAIVAAGPDVLAIPAGSTIAIDGTAGMLYVNPDDQTRRELAALDEHASVTAALAMNATHLPALTADDIEILVGANVGSVADAQAAGAHGADLAGLVRTEFLYLDRREAPTFEQQVDVYRALATALAGRRLTLRTLDVGGDKPLPYAPQPLEKNPFLGMRGIRLALAQQGLLHDQLRAIIHVAHETPVSVMFPMVSTLDELLEARRRLEHVIELDGRGTPEGLQIGIMVEVPATALKAEAFTPYIDFFSIGTNDLTQYALAAERGNPAVAAIGDPLDPGVLRLVDSVCRAAHERCLVAVCGELAADQKAAALLVALGVRELSVAPTSVPGIKQAVRLVAAAPDHDLLPRCLAATGAAEVRELLS